MKRSTSIKLKAAFLFILFATNTVVGFACAIGINMGFNSKHHHEDEATEAVIHVHKDGKKHVRQESTEKHDHHNSNHSADVNNNHKSGNGKDDCCNDKLTNFEQLDKSLPNTLSILHPVFFTTFFVTYYNINLLHFLNFVTSKKQFVRSYHPPIPDIRIAIQSFQI